MNRKIRIAHIVNYLYPAGKEVGVMKLLNHLDTKRFQGYLIVLDKISVPNDLDLEKTRLIYINKPKGNDFSLPFKLAGIFREHRFDIIHTHAWGTLVEGILAAKLARVPVTIHGEHGTFHRDYKRKWVQKIFFSWADYLLSVSDILADNLSRDIGVRRTKVTSILNGVDTQKFYPDPEKRRQLRKQLGLAEDTLLVGTVGRITPVKNQALMLKAYHHLRSKDFDLKMCIVGDDTISETRKELDQLVDTLGMEDAIIFSGIQRDIPAYLNAFDIFVLPSLSEGCSNVIQEAMATALPVIATDVGGNPELVLHDQNGLLFPSDHPDALASAIEKLVSDPEYRRRLGNNALNHTREQFSLQAMIENYQNFYLKVTDRAQHG